jgi:hypothetical protein
MHEVNFTIQPGNQAAAIISNSVDRRIFRSQLQKQLHQTSQSSSGICVAAA